MKPQDRDLERLFRAASSVPVPALSSPAFGLEARVLAAWRTSRGGASLWDMGVLVRGLALAGVLMVVSIWPAVSQSASTDTDSSLQLADSTVQTYLSQ
jgi:hypothetical protein